VISRLNLFGKGNSEASVWKILLVVTFISHYIFRTLFSFKKRYQINHLLSYYRSLYISEHSPLINTMKILYFSSFKIELYPFTSWHGHPLILFVHTCLQVILESLDKGVREGRQQVQAWLALLAARYNEALSSDARAPPSSIDVDFSQCPQLQMLPQLVFALLRSPLLRLHEEGVHPDYRIYLQCLFRFIIFLTLNFC